MYLSFWLTSPCITGKGPLLTRQGRGRACHPGYIQYNICPPGVRVCLGVCVCPPGMRVCLGVCVCPPGVRVCIWVCVYAHLTCVCISGCVCMPTWRVCVSGCVCMPTWSACIWVCVYANLACVCVWVCVYAHLACVCRGVCLPTWHACVYLGVCVSPPGVRVCLGVCVWMTWRTAETLWLPPSFCQQLSISLRVPVGNRCLANGVTEKTLVEALLVVMWAELRETSKGWGIMPGLGA